MLIRVNSDSYGYKNVNVQTFEDACERMMQKKKKAGGGGVRGGGVSTIVTIK